MRYPIIGITAERWGVFGRPDLTVDGVLPSYIQAVLGAGGLPLIVPRALGEAELRAAYARLDAVLIPGGGDIEPAVYHAPAHPATNNVDPDRDRVEIFLTRQAVADRKPYLGICRGVQVFNVALGGTLYQDLPSECAGVLPHMFRSNEFPTDHLAHPVQITEDSRLARLVGRPLVEVNSRHHQALKDLAPGLEVAARAPDQVIEAVELRDHPFALGVQWHPENLQARSEMKALFEGLVRAAQNRPA